MDSLSTDSSSSFGSKDSSDSTVLAADVSVWSVLSPALREFVVFPDLCSP